MSTDTLLCPSYQPYYADDDSDTESSVSSVCGSDEGAGVFCFHRLQETLRAVRDGGAAKPEWNLEEVKLDPLKPSIYCVLVQNSDLGTGFLTDSCIRLPDEHLGEGDTVEPVSYGERDGAYMMQRNEVASQPAGFFGRMWQALKSWMGLRKSPETTFRRIWRDLRRALKDARHVETLYQTLSECHTMEYLPFLVQRLSSMSSEMGHLILRPQQELKSPLTAMRNGRRHSTPTLSPPRIKSPVRRPSIMTRTQNQEMVLSARTLSANPSAAVPVDRSTRLDNFPNAFVSLPRFYNLCIWLLRQSRHREPIKFALCVLERLFPFHTHVALVQKFAQHEEFTAYAVYTALAQETSSLDDKESFVLALAKQLHGWGRVHVVRELLAKCARDDGLKRWLLTHGFRNSVDNHLLAFSCAVGGCLHLEVREAGKALKLGDPGLRASSIELLENAAELICLLIENSEEGDRLPGFTDYPNQYSLLANFINATDLIDPSSDSIIARALSKIEAFLS